jgi:hypothetical protein
MKPLGSISVSEPMYIVICCPSQSIRRRSSARFHRRVYPALQTLLLGSFDGETDKGDDVPNQSHELARSVRAGTDGSIEACARP